MNYLIGMTWDEAREYAENSGYELRRVMENGVPYVITDDYDPNRIDVEILDGRIHAIR